MRRRRFLVGTGTTVAGITAGCLGQSDTARPTVTDDTLTLTTTTSTYDTGLLSEVNAGFEDRFGARVETIATGTGAALQTAKNGDSDVVLVHARSLEDDFLRDGYGVNRRDLMFNDFVIIGPPDDPAGVATMDDPTTIFASIAEAAATFVSRGDNSGTHAKELEIWATAGIEPSGAWYRQAGSSMGEVLHQTNLTDGAYTIADRATFLSQQGQLDGLEVILGGPVDDGPEILANPYGIIATNPAVHEHVSYDLAMAYIGFFTSNTGQGIIESYTLDGTQLFFPQAIAENPNFSQYVPDDWQSN